MPTPNLPETTELLSPCSDDATVVDEVESNGPDALEKQSEQNQPLRNASTADAAIEHAASPSQNLRPVVLPPHIIVVYNTSTGLQTAWGREGVGKMGYHPFARMVFDAFVLHPSRAPKWEFSLFEKSKRAVFWEAYNHLRADFLARVQFKPQWASQSSGSDNAFEESVSLQPVGWEEMMQNLVNIQVEYQPPEKYPGKAELLKILGRSLKTN